VKNPKKAVARATQTVKIRKKEPSRNVSSWKVGNLSRPLLGFYIVVFPLVLVMISGLVGGHIMLLVPDRLTGKDVVRGSHLRTRTELKTCF
jgi:hypothetical protein